MEANVADANIELPGFVNDLRRRELRRADGSRLPLHPQAFAVLQYLARRAGELVGKDELMGDAWPGPSSVTTA